MLNLFRLNKASFWNIVLVSATILGAFGGFPQPPVLFQKIASFSLVQWLLVFVLAYQGGAGQDAKFAAFATAVTFVVYYVVRFFEGSDDAL